ENPHAGEETLELAERVTLSIHVSDPLIENQFGLVDFQIQNVGSAAIERPSLAIACKYIDCDPETMSYPGQLWPGNKKESPFTAHIKPQAAGHFSLHLKFYFLDGRKNYKCYTGIAKVTVYDKKLRSAKNISKVQVNIQAEKILGADRLVNLSDKP